MASIEKCKEILTILSSDITPILKGTHGTGKTELIRQISKEIWKIPCVELQGSQLSDVGDLIGLQKIVEYIDENGQKLQETVWVPPYWLPKDGQPVCLFLDEINRASLPIKRAMMQIGNDHRLLNFALPKGSRVICAINPSDDGEYDVEEFDDAEQDRFYEIDFTPTVKEWLKWTEKENLNIQVRNYIELHQNELDPYGIAKSVNAKSNVNDYKKPSRRSWTRLARQIDNNIKLNPDIFNGKSGNSLLELLTKGFVGPVIASSFAQFYQQSCSGITAEQIFKSDNNSWKKIEKSIKSMQMIELINLGTSICSYLKEYESDLLLDELTIKEKLKNLPSDASKLTIQKAKISDIGFDYADKLYKFLTTIPREISAQICSNQIANARGKDKWINILTVANDDFKNLQLELINVKI